MISFKDLFWEKWCKFLEKEHLKSEKSKRDFEETLALREQYMLGLLLPIRGKESFKVVVRDPFNFDYSMVKELLHRIGSPVKYYKYYEYDDVCVLEGFTDEKEYKSYKKAELYQLASIVFFYVVLFMVVYIFQRYVYGMYGIFIASLYLLVSALLVVGIGLLVLSLTPSESGNKSLIGYDIL